MPNKNIIETVLKNRDFVICNDLSNTLKCAEEMDLSYAVIDAEIFSDDSSQTGVSELSDLLVEHDASDKDVVVVKHAHYLPIQLVQQISMITDKNGYQSGTKQKFILIPNDKNKISNSALYDRATFVVL